ncbi:Kiwa anti-phage protein KwaB-like domain-containing protein [Salinisphaera sp. S4-8]|uniref:Kiwa anti-phage protein KwaB-like domain-containing protein n=1 Tax=Salinisphaera sp. S4-8 TaxID=633357 RepID=UPI00334034C3
MLDNFQLAVIVKSGMARQLYRVPLHQGLQKELAADWQGQLAEFLNDIQEVGFDAGYTPEAHERFLLEEYVCPEWLSGEDSESAHELPSINESEEALDAVVGVVAFTSDDDGTELVLFQNFNRAHVIRPGRYLLLEGNAYRTTEQPGLSLEKKLSAVFLPEEAKLLFLNFRTVNTFLPLAEFYEEAAEQDILEILNHELLLAEDPIALATSANQWFKKRFAMLRDSGLLDRYSAQQIVDHSRGYEINIAVDEGKIVFPSDRTEAKRLLQFLNEEIFRGAITETLYETNSKREAD